MRRVTIFAFVLIAIAGTTTRSQDVFPMFAVMGDSIGEGVQSADASIRTQGSSFASLMAQQLGAAFPLPLINTSPKGIVTSTEGRTRINPARAALNLAVSGSQINDLLNLRCEPPVNLEADLILVPRSGSQLEIAEQLRAKLYAVWIGNNDSLRAIMAWRKLDASQMTDLASFTTDYTNMIVRLQNLGTRVVVGTIPDVTQIGFLVSPQMLSRLTGSTFGLPQGSYTTLPTAFLIKLGMDDGSVLQNPQYVLDPAEIAAIQTRTDEFNRVIVQTATNAGMAVADFHSRFAALAQDPPVFYGLPLTFHFLGGLLSLDGLHPSNIGHALAANLFIQAANDRYGMHTPLISPAALNQIAADDPFIDWNGNMRVRGRLLAGFLETIGPFIGISADYSDGPGSGSVRTATGGTVDKSLGEAFKAEYLLLKGLSASTEWTREDASEAMNEIFGNF